MVTVKYTTPYTRLEGNVNGASHTNRVSSHVLGRPCDHNSRRRCMRGLRLLQIQRPTRTTQKRTRETSNKGEIGLPVRFVLMRWWPRGAPRREQTDLYEAIKNGQKTSEYRDDSDYWRVRLFNEKGLNLIFNAVDRDKLSKVFIYPEYLKHREATFTVGYVKYPRLRADIEYILWHREEAQFQVKIRNVREESE